MTDGGRTGRLVVLSGPSGVGKGTVLRRVVERLEHAIPSVSVTTRAPRPGETDGVHYHFVDDAEFDALVASDALLEWAPYAGARYGTPAQPVADARAAGLDVLLEIEVQGALQVRAASAEAILVFIAPPSFEELERRLRHRGTEADEAIAARLATAREELEAQGHFDHVVENDDLDTCVDDVVTAIESGR
ncbi:MAG: guanylate kinase [Actinobacteria bacterium]|nr:guanylate kinase [Actinomycetota bacterium]